MMCLVLALVWASVVGKEDVQGLEKAGKGERRTALKDGVRAQFLPIILIGGIRFGIFTPTGAAVVVAAFAIVVLTVI